MDWKMTSLSLTSSLYILLSNSHIHLRLFLDLFKKEIGRNWEETGKKFEREREREQERERNEIGWNWENKKEN